MSSKIKTRSSRQFIFEKYRLDRQKNTIYFFYSFNNGLNFTETLNLGSQKISWSKINPKLLDRLLFNLHLVFGLGYYKAYAPHQIIIKSGILSKDEAAFWNKLYTKGLGEFFYKNKIDFRGLINFPYQARKTEPGRINLSERSLLPWGGGKDSAVSAEILKSLGHDFTLISLRDSEVQKKTAAASGLKNKRLIINRTIDPRLIELNKNGVYNGHIPISAIYAWVTVLAAVVYDYRQIIYSNEHSANFGNVNYLGQEINHQYSKSLEFENDFRSYLKNFLTPDISYFSLLRAYSELKITKLFSRYPHYFSSFSSCNRNFSITKPANERWCGHCPKCAFVFSQLAAFLDRPTLIKIFNRDLLADPSLLPLYQELWGERKFKPFDCVGTPTEVKAALLLASQKKSWAADYIVKKFLKNVKPKIKNPGALINEALKNQAAPNIPLNFQKILILGYGLEGRFILNYLRKKYPSLNLGLADQKKLTLKDKQLNIFSGPNYLEAIKNYNLIIKSPGISDRLPEISAARNAGRVITSVTNLFLEEYGAQTIGVTGTKGKSTTASLIYQILKAAGRDVQLVGNIGFDPLQYLLRKKDPKKIFVYELSSYQLSTASFSPHVAVFINIFPDHLPYHAGFTNYFEAKTQIIKQQSATDYFIFNPEYPPLRALAKKGQGQAIDYLKKCSLKNNDLYYGNTKIIATNEIKLLGAHNIKNIEAAICAAKIYGVSAAAIRRALKKFANLEHRLELVGQYRGIYFYDDAISTTPESTLAALDVFKEKIGTIILGGEDRGYDFKFLVKKLAELDIKNIVLFPTSGARIAREIKEEMKKHKNFKPRLFSSAQMAAAVKFSYKYTTPGQICLLSCASPSYSLFKDFKEKGNLFKKYVKAGR